MDLKEIREKKKTLEKDIFELIRKFNHETEVNVTHVFVKNEVKHKEFDGEKLPPLILFNGVSVKLEPI